MEHKITFKDYNEALKKNKLLGLKCAGCGAIIAPPRLACRQCGSTDLIPFDLSGKGTIQTLTVVNVPPEGRESSAPYVVVMVQLEEGPWIMGNLSGIAPQDANIDLIGRAVIIDKPVIAVDKYSGGEVAGPVFALDAS